MVSILAPEQVLGVCNPNSVSAGSCDALLAGIVIASLLPLPSAKLLGVDSADASESESSSGSAAELTTNSYDAAAAR